jgi:hypothetical protein
MGLFILGPLVGFNVISIVLSPMINGLAGLLLG